MCSAVQVNLIWLRLWLWLLAPSVGGAPRRQAQARAQGAGQEVAQAWSKRQTEGCGTKRMTEWNRKRQRHREIRSKKANEVQSSGQVNCDWTPPEEQSARQPAQAGQCILGINLSGPASGAMRRKACAAGIVSRNLSLE